MTNQSGVSFIETITDIKKKKSKKKCHFPGCNEKITLISFTCKCDGIFCIKHKNPSSHECTYDYKKATTIKLEKVVAEKIVKI